MSVEMTEQEVISRETVRSALQRDSRAQGRVRALLTAISRFQGRDIPREAAMVLAAEWRDIGMPNSLLSASEREDLFLSLTPGDRLRTLFDLADRGDLDIANTLVKRLDGEERQLGLQVVALNIAIRNLRPVDVKRWLPLVLENSQGEDEIFYLRRSLDLIDSDFIFSLNKAQASDRISVKYGNLVNELIDRESLVFPELNSFLFSSEMTIPVCSHRPMSAILKHLHELASGGNPFQIIDILYKIVDKVYFLNGHPHFKILLASIIITLVDKGCPVFVAVVAFATGQMFDTGAWRYASELLLRANILPEGDGMGVQTYFLLRRACLYSTNAFCSRIIGDKVAATLPENGQARAIHRFFRERNNQTAVSGAEGRLHDHALSAYPAVPIERFINGAVRRERSGSSRKAVFICGQLRSFEGALASIMKNVVEPLDADLFIVTWDQVGFSLGHHGDIHRTLSPRLLSVLPREAQTVEAFTKAFPKTMAVLSSAAVSSKETIRKHAPDASFAVVDEAQFDAFVNSRFPPEFFTRHQKPNPRNQLKLFFLNRVCGAMIGQAAQETGQSYDTVIRLRPDMYINYFAHTEVVRRPDDENLIYIDQIHTGGMSDIFALGSEIAMLKYFSGFDFIMENNSFNAFQFHRDFMAEGFISDCANYWGLRVNTIQGLSYRLNSSRFSDSQLAALMVKDLEHQDGADPLRLALQAIADTDDQP